MKHLSYSRTSLLIRAFLVLGLMLVAGISLSAPARADNAAPAPSYPLRLMVPHPKLGPINMLKKFPQMDPKNGSKSLMPTRPFDFSRLQPHGTINILAILVKFSDHASTVTASSFDTLLFGTTGNTVRNFYKDVSYSKVDLVTVNAPSTMGWITAPQTYSYYVNNNYCTDGVYPNNCQKLAEDLANAVNPVVNFANYDNDGDGYVDTLVIIHSGPGAEFTGSTSDVWSHSWQTYNHPVLDGKIVSAYTIEPEYWLTGGDMTRGVYDHELGHSLGGLPDLYDVDYSSAGIGTWSLMSGGSWNGPYSLCSGGYCYSDGSQPAQFDAWSRVWMGFATATNATSFNQVINLPNVEQNSTGAIYQLNTGHSGEYFLLENRQQVMSDVYLPGNGMLIWHIDDNINASNSYECMSLDTWNCPFPDHFWVALVQADGLLDLEWGPSYGGNSGDTGDPYPGSTNNKTWNFTTTPNTSSYYFSTDPGLSVKNISSSGSTMTATIGNPAAAAVDAISLYSPANGVFYLKNSNTGGNPDLYVAYGPSGSAGWVPVIGDWNGNGTSKIGLYNPANGVFYLKYSNTSGNPDLYVAFGPAGQGWLPLAGKWTGGSTTGVGLYNPTTSAFYLRNTPTSGPADSVVAFGPPAGGWKPIVGHWTGAGATTIGLYNPTNGLFMLKNANSGGNPDTYVQYGPGGTDYTAIVGDWDGNGSQTIGLYRPSVSLFMLKNTNGAGNPDVYVAYGPGGQGWLPIVGHWTAVGPAPAKQSAPQATPPAAPTFVPGKR